MGSYQFHESASILVIYALFFSFAHLLFLSPKLAIAQQGDGVSITLSDFQALLAIKRELIDQRGTLKSWNGSRNSACSGSWAGIKCIKGQVVALQLPFKALGGRISSKIGLLKELRKLSLHDNLIRGTIPSSIGSLPNLRGLYLFNNRLSGLIPLLLGAPLSFKLLILATIFLLGLCLLPLLALPGFIGSI